MHRVAVVLLLGWAAAAVSQWFEWSSSSFTAGATSTLPSADSKSSDKEV
jgi:hypothetical protein